MKKRYALWKTQRPDAIEPEYEWVEADDYYSGYAHEFDLSQNLPRETRNHT